MSSTTVKRKKEDVKEPYTEEEELLDEIEVENALDENDGALDIVEALARQMPQSSSPYVKKYLPKVFNVLRAVAIALDSLSPVISMVVEKVTIAYQWADENNAIDDYIPMFVGFVYMFFGGYFAMTIACVEAMRQTGWNTLKTSAQVLYKDYLIIKAKSDADDLVDADNDGIADVKQISSRELLTRKAKLFMNSANPVELSGALNGMYGCFVSVLAAVKVEFARSIALGASLGETMHNAFDKYMRPILFRVLRRNKHKWVDIIAQYGFKWLGVSIALFLQRIVSSIHAATRGGQIFLNGFRHFAKRNNMTWATGHTAELAVALAGVLGFLIQLGNMYELPTYLQLFLFPFVILEYIIAYFVNE